MAGPGRRHRCRQPAGQRGAEDAARVRPLRALRGAQEVAHRRQHGAGGHAGAAGHLQDRARRSALVRRRAARRVHRRRAAGGVAMTRATAIALLACACTVGPEDRRPEIEVPKVFSEGSGRGAAKVDKWWTNFHDPLLESLVARAVEGNLDLKISSARILEARAARGIAASAGLPQVAANGGYARSKRTVSLGEPGGP